MKIPHHRLPAFILTILVLASYLQILLGPGTVNSPRGWVFLGAGVVYLLNALFWANRLEARSGLPYRLLYFAVQICVIAAILLLTPRRGSMLLLTLPIASQAFILLPRLFAAIVTGVLFATIYACFGTPTDRGVLSSFLGIGTGFAFVIAFTLLVESERSERLKREELATELEKVNAQLRAYSAQLGEVAALEERNRLAREIHDGLGHHLSLVVVQIEAAKATFRMRPDQFPTELEKAHQYVKEALLDVRRSVRSLRANEANVRSSLEELLRQLVAQQSSAEFIAKIEVVGEIRRLSANTEHHLFRLVQESLTNIRTHAGATLATIRLDFATAGRVEIVIQDNGRGAPQPLVFGNGLAGMRERMVLLDASFAAGNRPGGGFCVKASFHG
jgi:signal transduction histidine kinase